MWRPKARGSSLVATVFDSPSSRVLNSLTTYSGIATCLYNNILLFRVAIIHSGKGNLTIWLGGTRRAADAHDQDLAREANLEHGGTQPDIFRISINNTTQLSDSFTYMFTIYM